MRLRFYQQILAQVRQVPGVDESAATNVAPLVRQVSFPVKLVADTDAGLHPSRGRFSVISRGYFSTLGIRFIEGRDFLPSDDQRGIVVNQTLARSLWPGQTALGRRLGFTTTLMGLPPTPDAVVIGVVSDSREMLQRTPQPHVYVPLAHLASSAAYLVIRTHIDPKALIPQIKAAVWSIDPDQPLSEIHTMEELRADQISLQKLLTILLSSFGLVAALLALIGLTALVAYWVSQRTHEFGVRAALGASPGMLTQLGIRQILWPVLLGAVIGLTGAFNLTKVLTHYLFDARSGAVGLSALIVAGEITLALLAAWWPARQAGRINPSVALREE